MEKISRYPQVARPNAVEPSNVFKSVLLMKRFDKIGCVCGSQLRWVSGADYSLIRAMCNWREIPQGAIPLTKIRPTSWHRPSGPTGPRREICPRVVAVSSTPIILAFNTWRLLFCRTQIWPRTSTRAAITPDWTTSTPDRRRTTTSTTTTSRIASITCAGRGTRGRYFTRNLNSIYR